jgi:UDP-N-acetylglucosamine 2-epimerase (non-hydrolysing)
LETLKVLAVFGTRPEAIKLAPVIRELQRRAEGGGLQPVVCVTGQHRQMLDQVLDLFQIVPDHDLNVMAENQSPTQVACAVLAQLEPVLQRERPNWVLVQGDTTTVAAASLAAFYARARVGHVEAGLRTLDKWRPFPEEINRRLASVMADLHFAPTDGARQNLLREAVPAKQIVVTGNPVIDALRWTATLPASPEITELLDRLGIGDGAPASSNAGPLAGQHDGGPLGRAAGARRLVLVTAHRRENFGQPLVDVCDALLDLARHYAGQVQIVYPVHRNPNVWGPVHERLAGKPNITLLPPLEYQPLVSLMKQAHLVLTDSGGIQEEAPGVGVPVLVLRDVTERPEAVEAGTVRLVGTDRARIVREARRLLDDPDAHGAMARVINPYGDGYAAQRIVGALLGERIEAWSPALVAAP